MKIQHVIAASVNVFELTSFYIRSLDLDKDSQLPSVEDLILCAMDDVYDEGIEAIKVVKAPSNSNKQYYLISIIVDAETLVSFYSNNDSEPPVLVDLILCSMDALAECGIETLKVKAI